MAGSWPRLSSYGGDLLLQWIEGQVNVSRSVSVLLTQCHRELYSHCTFATPIIKTYWVSWYPPVQLLFFDCLALKKKALWSFKILVTVYQLRSDSWTLPGSKTNSCEMFSDMLWDRLKPVVLRKRRDLLSPGVCLQHVSAHSLSYWEQIQDLMLEVLHLPYSPSVTPSVFHLFCPPKRRASHQELKEAVHDRLTQQPKIFLYREIYAIVEPWWRCVGLGVDYIENMLLCYSCFYYKSLYIIFLVFIFMTLVYIPVIVVLSVKMAVKLKYFGF
jgi:hypothetical protein